MPRLPHGVSLTFDQIQRFEDSLPKIPILKFDEEEEGLEVVPSKLLLSEAAPFRPIDISKLSEFIGVKFPKLITFHDYRYLFNGISDIPANLLPTSPDTVAGLETLAAEMAKPAVDVQPDSSIPAIFTYIGQFIDHDITFDTHSGDLGVTANRVPFSSRNAVLNQLKNLRTSLFDLDSVYGSGSKKDSLNSNKFALASVDPTGPIPVGTNSFGTALDLPRLPPHPTDETKDRAAIIADPRNDENLIISQLQVAFLRAHNALIDKGFSFIKAKKTLIQHYQWMVLYDYLPNVVDNAILTSTIASNKVYQPQFLNFPAYRMPLEFSAAAFRFGHSMIRDTYNWNSVFPAATLQQLFTFTALSGNLAGLPQLPHNWVADWKRMVAGPNISNHARRIDTLLAPTLANLPPDPGAGLPTPPTRHRRLAERNLVRGYRLRLPTGQAVANHLGMIPLTPAQLKSSVPANQWKALKAAKFEKRTPLWFYILAEAAHRGGDKLGPVGSTIVAETIVGLVRGSKYSVLSDPTWKPTLGYGGTFQIQDLLRLANVLL